MLRSYGEREEEYWHQQMSVVNFYTAAAGAEETRRQPVDLPGTSGSGEAGAPQRRLLLDETNFERGRSACDQVP